MTGPCSVCGMHFTLRPDRTLRLHNRTMSGILCPGSGLKPADETREFYGWSG